MLQLITGIFLAIFLLVYGFYSSMAMKHAARFRYLSRRTVYLSMFFISASSMLIVLALILYGMLLLR